jgi:valyl-tRNA synthetase
VHTTIEPIVSKQWFVDMKPLAKPAIDAVRSGEIQFVPERFEKTYFTGWTTSATGVFPAALVGTSNSRVLLDACGETIVSEEAPPCVEVRRPGRQDEDVLDTWFSSGMWPFSTLGYPDLTEELKYFLPTSTLVTGYDIIFFWVARMMCSAMK